MRAVLSEEPAGVSGRRLESEGTQRAQRSPGQAGRQAPDCPAVTSSLQGETRDRKGEGRGLLSLQLLPPGLSC